MYLLDIQKIKEGDVILTAEKSLTSKIIRRATNSDFSHSMLYVGGGGYIHSDSDGVHAGSVQRLLISHPKYIKVLIVPIS